jgi:streptogramin lyase
VFVAGDLGDGGMVDGPVVAARFNALAGIAVDSSGNVYVADRDNHAIRKITSTGEVSTWANKSGQRGSTDGPAEQARFVVPTGITVDHAGNVYVCDYGNRTIRKITPRGEVSTLAGRPNPAAERIPQHRRHGRCRAIQWAVKHRGRRGRYALRG